MPEHPGGAHLIEPHLGTDVSNLFLAYSHSSLATYIARSYNIGKMVGPPPAGFVAVPTSKLSNDSRFSRNDISLYTASPAAASLDDASGRLSSLENPQPLLSTCITTGFLFRLTHCVSVNPDTKLMTFAQIDDHDPDYFLLVDRFRRTNPNRKFTSKPPAFLASPGLHFDVVVPFAASERDVCAKRPSLEALIDITIRKYAAAATESPSRPRSMSVSLSRLTDSPTLLGMFGGDESCEVRRPYSPLCDINSSSTFQVLVKVASYLLTPSLMFVVLSPCPVGDCSATRKDSSRHICTHFLLVLH